MLAFKMHDDPNVVIAAANIAAETAKQQGYIPMVPEVQCVQKLLFMVIGFKRKVRGQKSVFRVSTNLEDYGIGAGKLSSNSGWKAALMIDGTAFYFGEKLE